MFLLVSSHICVTRITGSHCQVENNQGKVENKINFIVVKMYLKLFNS